MHNWLLPATLMLVLACTSVGEPPVGFLSKTIKIKGQDIRYVVYVPRSYNHKKRMPAILFLNGQGECGTDGLRQAYYLSSAIMLNADKWPFIVIFPQKQDADHEWEEEEPMAMAILKKTLSEYKIDKSRIYLTGLSQGGHGTWAIAAMHPDMFAAIAPICGYGTKAMAEKVAKLPIWVFHGDADTAVLPSESEQMVNWVKEAGGSPKYTVYPGVGHNSWDNAYRDEDLPGWFLEHKNVKR